MLGDISDLPCKIWRQAPTCKRHLECYLAANLKISHTQFTFGKQETSIL